MTQVTSVTDLQALPNWVVFEQRPQSGGKKPRKCPFTPGTQRLAHVNDPATWRPYADAVADGRPAGIALTPDMNLTLIDVDGRIDHELIATLDSYAEESINGGTHILVRGRPPAGFVAPAGVEVYPRDGNRFLILTEKLIDGQDTIKDRTEILAELFPPAAQPSAPLLELNADDRTIIERVRCMAKGRQLFDAGDLSGYDDDHSRADQALLNCFRSCGVSDPSQFDRLFRESALMRPKWDRKDYRERTIAKALDGTVVPFEGWAPAVIIVTPGRSENGATAGNPQDAGTGDEGADVRDELATLRAEKATLLQQLAERDSQLAATRRRADKAEAELATLKLLQSATMTMLRSREMRPGEKVLGLVSLFEAEAAQRRGAIDAEGWSTVPMGRLADAGGCSADTASKHLSTIASTGVIEARTITKRDPDTGEIRKRRQIRIPTPSDSASASDLVGRITLLSTAVPERDPNDQGWGGKRVCPDCGDVGTITITTIACAGCGNVLSTSKATQAPASEDAPPYPHLAGTKNGRGYSVPLYPQDAGTGRDERRARAGLDLLARAESSPAPWDDPPPESEHPPTLFPLDDLAPPGPSHHFSAD